MNYEEGGHASQNFDVQVDVAIAGIQSAYEAATGEHMERLQAQLRLPSPGLTVDR